EDFAGFAVAGKPVPSAEDPPIGREFEVCDEHLASAPNRSLTVYRYFTTTLSHSQLSGGTHDFDRWNRRRARTRRSRASRRLAANAEQFRRTNSYRPG